MAKSKPAGIDLRQHEIVKALEDIAASHGGYLRPASVVDAARDPSNPLHSEFEWDDSLAADNYRIAQAGALIRRVKFTIVRPATEAAKKITVSSVRQFQSRPSCRTEDGGYEQVTEIMSAPEKRDELIDQVLKELAAYRKRYAELVALSEVWVAIDEALETLAPARQAEAGQARRGAASHGA